MTHNDKTTSPDVIARELGEPYTFRHGAPDNENARILFRRPFLINKKVHVHHENLVQDKITKNDFFVGIGGFKSLDFIARQGDKESRYQNAVLYDVNVSQIAAMQDVLDRVKKFETPEKFIEEFVGVHDRYVNPPQNGENARRFRLQSKEEQARYNDVMGAGKPEYQPQTKEDLKAYLEKQLKNPESWLHSDNYAHIRKLAYDDKIKLFYLDLRDENRTTKLWDYIKGKKGKVREFYISSVNSFMDPYLSTDYHSRVSSDKCGDASKFYDDLLSVPNDEVKYLLSIPNAAQSCFQDYHVSSLTKNNIDNMRSVLHVDGKPFKKLIEIPPELMRQDHQFRAGGILWRLMSINPETSDKKGNKPLYYRIFADSPIKDKAQLESHVAAINKIIANFKKTNQPDNVPVDSGEKVDSAILSLASNYAVVSNDAGFFEDQTQKAGQTHEVDPNHPTPLYLSSKPFMLETEKSRSKDPRPTLQAIEKAIIEGLEQGRHAGSLQQRRAGGGSQRGV